MLTVCLNTLGAITSEVCGLAVIVLSVRRGALSCEGRSAACLCSIALVARVLLVDCVMAWFVALDDVCARVARISISVT